MSSYAIIELERSGEIGLSSLDLTFQKQCVYGENFYNTWSILDRIAERNGWKPLSYFCVEEVSLEKGGLKEQWYDPKVGLETVSGLLNKFIYLVGQGAIAFSSSESQRSNPELENSFLSKDEILLREAIKKDQSFNYALWELRIYELILRRAIDNKERFRIYVSEI